MKIKLLSLGAFFRRFSLKTAIVLAIVMLLLPSLSLKFVDWFIRPEGGWKLAWDFGYGGLLLFLFVPWWVFSISAGLMDAFPQLERLSARKPQ